jgi:glutamine cyclotransferase
MFDTWLYRRIRRPAKAALTAVVALAVAVGCQNASSPGDDAGRVAQLRPVVLDEMPHDPGAFTQGLELDGAALYEGTGLVGKSQLRELDPSSGAVRRAVPLPAEYFGEGITVVDNRIWQLTWRDGVAIEWDKASFTPLREVPVEGEGWGLCRDGDRVVRSDGTDQLHFHSASDLAETGSVSVTHDGAPVTELNELECVDGQVWANIWLTDQIVRIDPQTGEVTAVVDAAGLLDSSQRAEADVLNGIAYLGDGEFLLTGKNWPTMFRVRFEQVE